MWKSRQAPRVTEGGLSIPDDENSILKTYYDSAGTLSSYQILWKLTAYTPYLNKELDQYGRS